MAASASTVDTFTNGRGERLRQWFPVAPENIELKAVLVMVHGVGDHVASYANLSQPFANSGLLLCGYDQSYISSRDKDNQRGRDAEHTQYFSGVSSENTEKDPHLWKLMITGTLDNLIIGHGLSEGNRVDVKDFCHYADDLIMFMSLVKEKYKDTPIFCIGHSMGGLVLGHALLREPELCKGVVFYAAAVHANPKIVTPFKIAMAKCLAVVFPSCPLGSIGDGLLTRNTEEMKRLEEDPLRHHGGMKARWGSCTLKGLIEFNTRMNEIKLPSLILHGEEDQICSIEGSQKLQDTLASADKEFKVYEKSYHRLHTEPDGIAERFIDDITQWVLARC